MLRNKHIKGLDALRAFSISLVLLNHLGIDGFFPSTSFFKNNFWSLISGETGVRIFFVLSGFLITRILWTQFMETGNINLKQFFMRRILRLMPPLIVFYAIVISFIFLGWIVYDIKALIFAVFYLYNYVPLLNYQSELAHLWTLSLEEQFYLVSPFVILIFKKYKVIFCLIIVFISISILATYIFPEFAFKSHLRPSRWFIPAGGYIAVGAMFSMIQSRKDAVLWGYFSDNYKFLVISIVLFVLPLALPIFLIQVFSFVQAIGIGIFVFWLYYNQKNLIVRVLEWRPIAYIGRISYGIYVYQGLFLLTGPGSEIQFQQFPINIFLAFGLAIVSYQFVEKPFLKYKRMF